MKDCFKRERDPTIVLRVAIVVPTYPPASDSSLEILTLTLSVLARGPFIVSSLQGMVVFASEFRFPCQEDDIWEPDSSVSLGRRCSWP
jgi:hypothetical protein